MGANIKKLFEKKSKLSYIIRLIVSKFFEKSCLHYTIVIKE